MDLIVSAKLGNKKLEINDFANLPPVWIAPQSRQDRAGDAQAQRVMDDLYAEMRELRAELEAANGYIRSLENRCAMYARQLGYG